MIKAKTNNVSKLDIINARCSTAFKDVPGAEINIKGAAVITDDETGIDYSYVWSDEGVCYAGNSAAIGETVQAMIPLIDDDEMLLRGTVVSRTSKQGKDFLSLQISQR